MAGLLTVPLRVEKMLISHEYRFIFIKTRKTAGTSIEIELAKVMGESDVVTPILPAHQDHRPRNVEHSEGAFRNHMPASEVRDILGPKIFDGYYKFTVEREPVDKCISHYSMLRNSPDHNERTRDMSWSDYVARGIFPVDHKKYLDRDGTLMVDRVLAYESLDAELRALGVELGFRFDGLRARAKAGFREEPQVTSVDRAKIYAAFASSCAVTGYRPGVYLRP